MPLQFKSYPYTFIQIRYVYAMRALNIPLVLKNPTVEMYATWFDEHLFRIF